VGKHSLSEAEILRRLDEQVHPPRKKSDEIEWTEQELRCGLAALIRMLRGAVADTVRQGVLKRDEYGRLRRQRHSLLFIPGLVKVLYHPDPKLRRQRLYELYAALGAVAVIFGHRVDDPILSRLHTARATKNRVPHTTLTSERTAEIIEDEFNKLREKYPNNDFKKDGPWKTGRGRDLHKSVTQRLEQEDLPGLEEETIGRYLYELPLFSGWREYKSRFAKNSKTARATSGRRKRR
jgi:hypothetical protein